MHFVTAIVVAMLACVASPEGRAAVKKDAMPAGVKVVSGRHFDLYVSKLKEKSMAAGATTKLYQVVAVARTQKHGTQQIRRRVETVNADLLDSANWEVVDFDKDGWDDFRYVRGMTQGGCRTWDAQRWEPGHDRFTSAPKHARWSDAQGRTAAGTCAGKK